MAGHMDLNMMKDQSCMSGNPFGVSLGGGNPTTENLLLPSSVPMSLVPENVFNFCNKLVSSPAIPALVCPVPSIQFASTTDKPNNPPQCDTAEAPSQQGDDTSEMDSHGNSNAHPMPTGDDICVRCRYDGCDIKIHGCGCLFHARCIPLITSIGADTPYQPLMSCPHCKNTSGNLMASKICLLPMSFRGIDDAAKALREGRANTGRKRKSTASTTKNG